MRAVGVRLRDGREVRARTVVSNATRWNTFGKLLPHVPDNEAKFRELYVKAPSFISLHLGVSADCIPVRLPRERTRQGRPDGSSIALLRASVLCHGMARALVSCLPCHGLACQICGPSDLFLGFSDVSGMCGFCPDGPRYAGAWKPMLGRSVSGPVCPGCANARGLACTGRRRPAGHAIGAAVHAPAVAMHALADDSPPATGDRAECLRPGRRCRQMQVQPGHIGQRPCRTVAALRARTAAGSNSATAAVGRACQMRGRASRADARRCQRHAGPVAELRVSCCTAATLAGAAACVAGRRCVTVG